MTASAPIAFIDLQAQRARMGAALEESILRVVRSGRYIMGPEVGELERKLAEFCGAPYALSCANGTDALALLLMLKDLKPGQAVLVPSFTFAATGEVVVWFGATPIFVDCDEATFCVDPASVEAGVARAKALGLEPVGVIAVDLFGHPADYDALEPIARKHGLWLMSDCAQGFGATSFFPAEPLGCYGDGGAVFVRDKESVAVRESLRVHGQGEDKYDNVRVGMNGRMDTIQAAVLLHKLAIFEDEIEARQRVAARYAEGLGDVCGVPRVADGCVSTWAQYTIRVPADRRAAIVEDLKKAGVPTAIYYVRPMHRQTAYARYPLAGNGLPVSERLSREALSLPMHTYLTEADQDRVVRALRAALAG
jgi:dTDP-4-amino-4,6-dideoxygalactose transaminase